MTLPSRLRSSDFDVNSLMNNREFQEMLQEYFQSNTMTLDDFLENLPRFLNELEDGEDEDEFSDENIDIDENSDYYDTEMRRLARFEPLDPSENLFRSLLIGRMAAAGTREIPLRTILPQSPPPSPTPNFAFIRNRATGPPPLPARNPQPPPPLRRTPSQLRRSTSTNERQRFDPNAPEECKSPYNQLNDLVAAVPLDRNNGAAADLPMTREFMRRYGFDTNKSRQLIDDEPER